MKKLITFLLTTVFLICEGFSQVQQMTFGIRGSIGTSHLLFSDDDKDKFGRIWSEAIRRTTSYSTSYNTEDDFLFNYGFSIYTNYNFQSKPNLGLQTELGFLFNNGAELTCRATNSNQQFKLSEKYSYTSLEIPVLLTYTFNKGGFIEVIPQGGFYLSFPFGKCSCETNIHERWGTTDFSNEEKYEIKNFCMLGFATGCDVAMNFTEISALVLNLRYMFDFNKTEIEEIGELAQRSVFLFSAGYRYTVR